MVTRTIEFSNPDLEYLHIEGCTQV